MIEITLKCVPNYLIGNKSSLANVINQAITWSDVDPVRQHMAAPPSH